MDIVSILGFGAIGLGFLLAYLAYRLLANGPHKERPIYIFMAFCLIVVLVGATLQYNDSQNKAALEGKIREYEALKAQVGEKEKLLLTAQANLTETQSKLSSALSSLSSAQSSLTDVRGQAQRMGNSMQAIVETLRPIQAPLRDAHAYMVGKSCSGGGSGVALEHGGEHGGKMADALTGIVTAEKLASQYVPAASSK